MDTSRAPTNPLKDIRQSRFLSQEYVARRAHLTRQLVIRAEQGVYPNPPPALLEYLLGIVDPAAVEFEPDSETVCHLYHNFQTFMRKRSYGKLNPHFSWESIPVGVHPWVEWRVRSGIAARIGPAKFFCVHPALLHKFEVQPHLVQSVPGDLSLALATSGYSKETLDGLSNAYDTYKGHLREEFLRMQSPSGHNKSILRSDSE